MTFHLFTFTWHRHPTNMTIYRWVYSEGLGGGRQKERITITGGLVIYADKQRSRLHLHCRSVTGNICGASLLHFSSRAQFRKLVPHKRWMQRFGQDDLHVHWQGYSWVFEFYPTSLSLKKRLNLPDSLCYSVSTCQQTDFPCMGQNVTDGSLYCGVSK